MRSAAVAVFMLVVLVPGVLAAQGSDDSAVPRAPLDGPRRFSLHFAAGSHIGAGGNIESASMGFSVTPRLELLVSGERNHVPTRVQYFEGGSGATRGGTLAFVSAELRVELLPLGRLSPYVLAGMGRGVARPNVNEVFPDPDPVSNSARMVFYGGGVRIPVRPRLSVFVDARFLIDGEQGEVCLFLPVRGGVAWRF